MASFLANTTALFLLSQVSIAHSFDWEGKWAKNNPQQCRCEVGTVDTCPAGRGLPPLMISLRAMTAPELFCRTSRIRSATPTDFDIELSCENECEKSPMRVRGEIRSKTLSIWITGPLIDNGMWQASDYNRFTIKCQN